MDALTDWLRWAFGVGEDTSNIGFAQLSARAVLVYLVAFLLVRFGNQRFLGRNSAFDIVLGFIFGSALSRSINGSDNLFETSVAMGVLIAVHWAAGGLALKSKLFSKAIKGMPLELVADGKVNEDVLRRARIGDEDLIEAIRTSRGLGSISEVDAVYFERNGSISVLPKKKAPRVVEVEVEAGVQRVRIEIG